MYILINNLFLLGCQIRPVRALFPPLPLTWASVRPSMAASCFLSGLVTYFWISNLFSSPFLCRLEKTALDHDLFLLYVCGMVSLVRTAYGPATHERDTA